MKNGLIIEDKLIGEGNVAEQYSIVTVHYSGRLQSGKYFDSTNEIGREPFRFTLGAGQVIKGWDQGLIGMKVGGKRKLTIPPSLGYEDRDMGVIPPNSTLIFVIELIEVE
ncbi:MAG: FKBP-type peptidyl-prolyl cis-trans isomerase [Candidatus Neomarinimicrobiota bacterium]